MSSEEASAILEPAATRVRDPRSGRSIWMAGLLQEMQLKENCLSFTLQCHPEHSEEQIKRMEVPSSFEIPRDGPKMVKLSSRCAIDLTVISK